MTKNSTRMTLRSLPIAVLALLLVGTAPARPSEAPEKAAASDMISLDDFELLQYVATGKYPPAVLIALDNNKEILAACREGLSLEELRATGIEFTQSQLELLVAMNLMFRDGVGDFWLTFPILDEAEMTKLRAEMSSLAQELSTVVQEDLERLTQALEEAGHGRYGYSVVFSYVLDGMVWGFFEEYKRVPARRLSLRRPFWSGEIWAVRPGRASHVGTHSINHGDLILKVSSSERPGVTGGSLFENRTPLREGLEGFAKTGKLPAGDSLELYKALGLADEDSVWLIPVIDEIEKGPVFRAAETLTSNLVDAILERIDLDGLQERYGFRTAPQALVISYHELMWDLLEGFVADGMLKRPEILSNPEKIGRSSLDEVAFLLDRRPPKPDRQDRLEPKFDPLEESKMVEPRR